MRRLFRGVISKKVGLPPGSLVHVGEEKGEAVKITVFDYDAESYREKVVGDVEECFPLRDTPTVSWINVDGVHSADVMEKMGKHFDIHPLVLEDIMNTNQYPKIEDFEGHIFVIGKMISQNRETGDIESEQVSLILGPTWVISFQDKEGDIFDPIRVRLRTGRGRLRKMGSDFLAYTIMDTIVDHYFLVLENLGDRIEELEEELTGNTTREMMKALHDVKKDMVFLRKSIWPMREVVNVMLREELILIKESTHPYLRDLYDHTIQVIDSLETFHDLVSGLLDLYLSSLSNRMNEVMKVLTIIATLFIPVTFIVGIYGMNFKYMPELGWKWGYGAVWLVILGVITTMLFYFRRKKWL